MTKSAVANCEMALSFKQFVLCSSLLVFGTDAFVCPRSHSWAVTSHLSSSQLFAEEPSRLRYDLAIRGGGIVGVQAALVAKQQNKDRNVVLIDAPKESGVLYDEANKQDLSIGGPTGLFSKALRDVGKKIKVSTLRGMGLREDSVWNEILSSCVDMASSNAQDVFRQLDMAGVEYMEGLAQFQDTGETDTLIVRKEDGRTHKVFADKILLATGSKPYHPPGIPFDGRRIFDSDSINGMDFLPKSIAITGSGIIAIEYAKILRNLGAEVTLIIRDQVPRNALMKIGLDKDVAAVLVAALIRSGITIIKGAQVKEFTVPSVEDEKNGIRPPVKLKLEAKGGGKLPTGVADELKCDVYMAAVGRAPNTQSLNLPDSIVMDEYGGVLVNSDMQTTANGIYAAGDVVGRPFLASTGMAQAQAAANTIFSDAPSVAGECEEGDAACVVDGAAQAGSSFDPASLASNPFAFPTGVWTTPEVATYGVTLEQAESLELGEEIGEAVALYMECLRGRVFAPDGLLKLVYIKPAGRILGVHICGEAACELVHYGMQLIKSQQTVEDCRNSLYSAVTFHELYKLAAEAAFDEAGARKRRAAAGKVLAQRNREIRDAD